MSEDLARVDTELGSLGARVREIGDEIKSLVEQNSAESKARLEELRTEQSRITEAVEPLLKDREMAELREQTAATQSKLESLMGATRSASKASIVNGGHYSTDPSYRAGQFLGAIVGLNSPMTFAESKATLDAISAHEESWGKATLGSTDATGGWVIPNALVDEIIKPAAFQRNPYAGLVTNVNGVTAAAVDLPFRSSSPARALVAPFGDTKENVDLAYNGYTATIYTLARVHDLGAQFVRQSQGAAERDVLQELATAFARGERYYIVSGSGTAEPYGLQTAITNAPATFTSSFTAGATQAGSMLSALATAAGALSGRGRTPEAAIVNQATLWTLVAQGTDNAGFWFAGTNGAPSLPNVANGTVVTPFGIPVIGDEELASDDLIVGEFSALKVFHGQSYRVDSSAVAGTRWDKNIIGFRGEAELGLDARPAVYAGAFQFVADIVP